MADDDNSQYNNSHRAYLQAFLARSVLTLDEAKPILAAIMSVHGERTNQRRSLRLTYAESCLERREIFAEDITEADFNGYTNAANTAISPFDLEIRSTYHQTSRKRIYALVNATEDPIAQLATSHTADEISYLKRVLDAMFESNNTSRREIMAITSMEAVRLCKAPVETPRETQNGSATQGSAGQHLTMVQAEKMLKALVEEGWFEKSARGFYSLSARALMELRGWLLDTYNDMEDGEDDDEERPMRIKRCLACKEIITVVSVTRPSQAAQRCFSLLTRRLGSKMPEVSLLVPIP